VLAAVAETLRDGSPGGTGTGLYEPGTVALVVPGASRFDAAKIAEQRRKAIERQPVDVGGAGGRVHVTASVGVAAMDAETAESLVEAAQLVNLADGALRAARAAGPNCVRVFNPRPAHAPSS
jgi:diguanylate cyclase (GGDEF)-like protein